MNYKLRSILPYATVAIAGLYLSSCTPKTGTENGVGLDRKNLDTTVSPGDNFYQFANGGWLKNNPIPASESIWGAFSELRENNNKILHNLLDESAAKKDLAKGSVEQLVGDFYASGMDSTKLEQDGVSSLKPEFDMIQAIANKEDAMKVIAHLQTMGFSPLFSFYAYIDQKNSSAYITYANQGGLGLPDRDYYTKSDVDSKKILSQYEEHITKMFELMGDAADVAKTNAKTVVALETELAKSSMTRVQLRDPQATYNKMDLAGLAKLTPAINWPTYLGQLGVKDAKDVVIGQPEFFKKANTLLASSSVDTWKAYLRWQLIHGTASELNQALVMENFRFNSSVLNGVKAIKPRWKRVLSTIDGTIGDALGQLYVNKAFKPEAKEKALAMVNNLGEALKERINALDWMGAETKQKALVKLGTFMKKIGYPDTWKDYKAVDITRDSYVRNTMNAQKAEFMRGIERLNKPVDKTEWLMSPPTVNAYYNPPVNEIVFPAGILQPPFYDPNADDAVNYGGIGSVIGHEMTHGFDDEGRQYDAQGNLKDWWTPEDAKKFLAKADVLVTQYSSFQALDTLKVNGKLTLGENIADMGGITIALQAFKKTEEFKEGKKIDGFTPLQRFFLSWAQVWRNNITPEALKVRLNTDPHSPGRFRTNGIVSNVPEFYEAFGVKEGQKMYIAPAQRATIW